MCRGLVLEANLETTAPTEIVDTVPEQDFRGYWGKFYLKNIGNISHIELDFDQALLNKIRQNFLQFYNAFH